MDGHVPVLLAEVLDFLQPAPNHDFIDGTVGAGGHAEAILDRTGPQGRLLGLDRDPSAIDAARRRLERFGVRSTLIHCNFDQVVETAEAENFRQVQGILVDLGMSSMMVDDAARGFSFLHDGPLDMRMDPAQRLTASDIVNTYSEREIADILFQFGEERRSRPIARSIVHLRPHRSSADLVNAIQRVTGPKRFGRIHPATLTFQALRVAVNDELGSLERFLDSAPALLGAGGRLCVISFHSLEDRIVKWRFRKFADPNAEGVRGRVLTKKVVTATEDEVHVNPRSRSAKLRVWERL